MKVGVQTHRCNTSQRESLVVPIVFSAFTSSTTVRGPFGIASSLKRTPPPQKAYIIGTAVGFEPISLVLETSILPIELSPHILAEGRVVETHSAHHGTSRFQDGVGAPVRFTFHNYSTTAND